MQWPWNKARLTSNALRITNYELRIQVEQQQVTIGEAAAVALLDRVDLGSGMDLAVNLLVLDSRAQEKHSRLAVDGPADNAPPGTLTHLGLTAGRQGGTEAQRSAILAQDG